jgi:hypothetical protein
MILCSCSCMYVFQFTMLNYAAGTQRVFESVMQLQTRLGWIRGTVDKRHPRRIFHTPYRVPHTRGAHA